MSKFREAIEKAFYHEGLGATGNRMCIKRIADLYPAEDNAQELLGRLIRSTTLLEKLLREDYEGLSPQVISMIGQIMDENDIVIAKAEGKG